MIRSAAGKVAWMARATTTVVGLAIMLALVFGVASTALGANGGNFILGKGNNVATKVTGLIGKVATGSSLVVKNPSGGSALGLSVGDPLANPATKTVAPMKVDSQARVANLNADKLDGKEPGQLPGSIASITTINTFPGIPFDLGTNSAGWKFVGDPETGITTTSSQRLVGAAEVPLGDPTATSFGYDLCYRPSGGTTLTPFSGSSTSSGTLWPNDVVYTATSSVVPDAGTWDVGFCVLSAVNDTRNAERVSYVNGWVMVVNQ